MCKEQEKQNGKLRECEERQEKQNGKLRGGGGEKKQNGNLECVRSSRRSRMELRVCEEGQNQENGG